MTPLTDDKLTDFHTWKRAGIALEPFKYTFKGEEFSCGAKECFLTQDMYRGHHNYGMQFYFGLAQGVTDAGDYYGILLQAGIGSKYTGADRASEDQININGEVFKLDQIKMEHKVNDERSAASGNQEQDVHFSTLEGEEKRFPENSCKVVFKSDKVYKEGVNLVLLAHRRDLHMGTYDIDCIIEGKTIKQSNVRGMYEHIWSRI